MISLPIESPLGWLILGLTSGLCLGLIVAWLMRQKLQTQLLMAQLELQHHKSTAIERDELLQLASERLGHRFDQLSGNHFRQQSETLIKLARESLGAQQESAKLDLAAREHAIENLVKPIQTALKLTETRLEALDRAGRETHGNIKAQLISMATDQNALVKETRTLVNALKKPEVRGQWGELTLKRLVELAGMVEHCDFDLQHHRNTSEGAIRPDMIVNLPEDRMLVVDVKTPLDAYLQALEADSEDAQKKHLRRHSTIVAERVRELSAKGYWNAFEKAPDFVILFIPGDQFLSAALQERGDLLEFALQHNVIIATPTSFVALLKAVSYGWQQIKLADNAAEIRTLAVQLYERLGNFSSHLATAGKTLRDSVKAYNRAVGSLERMVLPSARRFTELGISPRRELEDTPQIDEATRIANEKGWDA